MNNIFNKCANYKKAEDLISKLLPFFVVADIVVLVLFHGGYYAYITYIASAIALLFALIVIIYRRACKLSLSSLFVLLVSIALLLSTVVNTTTITSLLSLTSFLSLLAPCALIAQLDRSRKWDTFCLLTIAGLLCSVVGLLMVCGVINLEGGIDSSGLGFTFQYANAAGIWFCIVLLLCIFTLHKFWKFSAVLPLAALIFTQSLGSLLALAAVLFVLFIVFLLKPQALLMCNNNLEANSSFLQRFQRKDVQWSTYIIAIIASCILIPIAVLSLFFIPLPQTFVERLIQIKDGFTLLLANPLGVGANMWQYIYPYVQSAQYTAANLHCSYMQLALDGGIVVFLLFIIFIVISIWKLANKKQVLSISCIFLLLLHAIFDFDLSFSSLWLVLFLLLESGGVEIFGKPKTHEEKSGFAQTLISASLLAFGGVAIIAGFVFNLQMNATEHLFELASQESGVSLLSKQPAYIKNDPKARANFTTTLAASDNRADVINNQQVMSFDEALFKAVAFGRNGDKNSSYDILLKEMEKEKFNIDYVNEVRDFLTETNADQTIISRFNQLTDVCNSKIYQWPASCLTNQQEVEKIQ